MSTFTTAMSTQEDSLESVGGKGRSLAKLANAGFKVPGGFQVFADAYRNFIAENKLQSQILTLARPALKDGYPVFEKGAEDIRQLIVEMPVDPATVQQIKDAYAALEGDSPAVAVCSSANAEDLPGFSFAGQQETYLNVRGGDAVVQAVQKCWASLWTPQAISYRHQNGIEQDSVAMAVVVQIMVPSEVSGILFTANPVNGERSEMVVNASFGLGEAVVSGQVTPDNYIVDRNTLTAKETMLGVKERQVI